MTEASRIQELRVLGNVPEGTDDFELLVERARFRVTYSGGSSSSITLRARYDVVATAVPPPARDAGYRDARPLEAIRPLAIELAPETHRHREGKESGVDVEVQTGDAAFDGAVYIDTSAPAEITRDVLGPSVRGAVLELFAVGFEAVTIDDKDGDVTARCTTFPSREDDSGHGVRAARAFAKLCAGLPPVGRRAGEYEAHPLGLWSTLGLVLGVLFLCVDMPAYMFFVSSAWPECMPEDAPMSCVGPALLGGVASAVLAVVASVAAAGYARRFRGRSNSSSKATAFVLASGFTVWTIGGLLLALVLVLLDVGR